LVFGRWDFGNHAQQYSLHKGNFYSHQKLATMPALLRKIGAAAQQFQWCSLLFNNLQGVTPK
jgi:hypothetical protein